MFCESKSFEEFNELYFELSNMETREELENWAQTNNHSTLLGTKDSDLEQYSDILLVDYRIEKIVLNFLLPNLFL